MNEQLTLPEARVNNEIAVREFYNEFSPPRYARRLVSRLLFTVPLKYTRGLDSVVLTNLSGAPRRWRLGKVTSRKRRVPQDRVLGRYHHAHKGQPAWIELYVDRLVAGVSYHGFVPFARTACFGMVLFHEIGHHVHTTIRPEFSEKEDVADDWGKKLMKNYMLKHCWYIPKPAWKIIGRILRVLSGEL
jgi:hypothetical protein